MAYKQSPREKMLRRIAGSLRYAKAWEVGSAHPEDRESIKESFNEELDFIKEEIRIDRYQTI